MLNAEKYRAEILGKDCKFGLSNRICKCCYEECATCVFSLENNPNDGLSHACTIRKVKWLLSEYKEPIKLSKLEYGILKHILNHTEYRYIVRSFNNVYVYTHEPINDLVGGIWCVGEGTYEKVSPLKDLFQFVKDGEYDPMLIKDILNNCEVVDYD